MRQSFLFILTLLLISACKNDEDIPDFCPDPTLPSCPDYDPCTQFGNANAEFSISYLLDAGEDDYPAFEVQIDTVWNNRSITMRALHENESYEWLIGADPTTRTGKEIELYFGEVALGNVEIRLVTTVVSNEECLEEYQLRDTSYQTIHFLNSDSNRENTTGIFGKFLGSIEGSNEEYIVEVATGLNPENDYAFGLLNFPKDCDMQYSFKWSYRHFLINAGNITNCNSPKGFGEIQGGGQILVIKFTQREFDTDNQQWVGERGAEMTFTGIRQ